MKEEIRPSIHKKWIKEGKMTIQESDRIIDSWKFQQATKAQMEAMTDAEKLGAYQDENGEWIV